MNEEREKEHVYLECCVKLLTLANRKYKSHPSLSFLYLYTTL